MMFERRQMNQLKFLPFLKGYCYTHYKTLNGPYGTISRPKAIMIKTNADFYKTQFAVTSKRVSWFLGTLFPVTTMTKTRQNVGENENVITIDLDSYCVNDVNMNIPNSFAKKPRRSKQVKGVKKLHMETYIYIDDDDDDDAESLGKQNPVTADTGIPQKSFPPTNLSKTKRMYPGRGPASYGLNIQLDKENDDGTKRVIREKEGEVTDVIVESGTIVVPTAAGIEGSSIEGGIVTAKEKIKETVEYKQAQEEELLARQLALKVQAEEAQQQRRLLKRKKTEKLRLLDIKRRQKQRVEEIRESQKQDEENMTKKETYRIEVQQNLKRLEMTCHDMASLLCGLGIFVNSPFVTSDQVRAAYKRALLSFHPDRASGCDMRQQVEAEEKFKLISRMKDRIKKIPSLK